jgi:hypothetical protein
VYKVKAKHVFLVFSYLLMNLFRRTENKSFNKHGRIHLIPESLGLLKSTKEGLLVLCGKKNVANH